MAIPVRTKRKLRQTTLVATGVMVVCIAFVFYFMHAVYEAEDLLTPESVPQPVQAALLQLYPNVTNNVWEFEEEMYEAEFNLPGDPEVEAHFSADGKLVKTVRPTQLENLPKKARTYLASRKWVKVKQVEIIEYTDEPATYEVEIGNLLMAWDCQFDKDGNLLSKEREEGSALEEVDEDSQDLL